MKANELMIGDWVNSYLDEHPIQLDDDGFYTIIKGYDDGIEPIPLTLEILEKNGWINKTSKGWMQKGNFGDSPLMLWYTTDTGTFNKHFANELELSDLSCDKGYRLKVQCQYVHELQHALRLCGLNDLADNFKI